MKRFFLIFFVTAMIFFPLKDSLNPKLAYIKNWVCFYGHTWPANVLNNYNLYIFSTKLPTNFTKPKNAKLFGYLSVGEVNENDPDYKEIVNNNLIIEPNPNWPEAKRIHISHKNWQNIIINKTIPRLTQQGFDGIFIDTIDTAAYLENSKNIPGSMSGAINLIKQIKKTYPNLLLIMNNGFELYDQLGSVIDGVMVESVFTHYDFATKQYQMANSDFSKEKLSLISKFKNKFNKPVLLLEYLDPANKDNIALIRAKAEKQGFLPYITTIDLNDIN